MREKLLDLMKNEGLKPSQLAEMLEINPAGISHILAGRNKPGFDLLQKMLRRFPQISPDWLLLDSGPMYRNDSHTASVQTTTAPTKSSGPAPAPATAPATGGGLFGPELSTGISTTGQLRTTPAADGPGNSPATTSENIPAVAKTSSVARIVILHDDGSFESYFPKK